MEKLERDVLKILSEDCRYTASKIAVMLGSTETAVKDAIKRLEESGAVVKYSAIVNDEKADENAVNALIEVRVTPQKMRGFDAIAEEIYNFPEVKSLYLMSGGFDLAVFVEGKSLRDVAQFVSDRLSVLDTVVSTATHFILKKYKIEGTVTAKTSVGTRLAFQP